MDSLPTTDKKQHLKKRDLMVIGLLLVIAVVLASLAPLLPSREALDQYTSRLQAAGPLTAIGLIVLETVVAPIPGVIIPVSVGIIYGVWPGLLYAWLGNVIGSMIAFALARTFGRPLVRKLVHPDKIAVYDHFLQRNRFMLWLLYMVPVFPLDITSLVIGLSSVSARRFFRIVSIGFAVNMFFLTFFGDRLVDASDTTRMVLVLILVGIIGLAIFTEKLVVRRSA